MELTKEVRIEKFIDWMNDKKAEDIVLCDLTGKVSYADSAILCCGTNELHIKAIANNIIDKAKEEKIFMYGKEGFDSATWILLDFSDIIIHIFHPNERTRLKLEDLWNNSEHLLNRSEEVENDQK